jgi:hypothetical protein
LWKLPKRIQRVPARGPSFAGHRLDLSARLLLKLNLLLRWQWLLLRLWLQLLLLLLPPLLRSLRKLDDDKPVRHFDSGHATFTT